jgi:hypothetical protein
MGILPKPLHNAHTVPVLPFGTWTINNSQSVQLALTKPAECHGANGKYTPKADSLQLKSRRHKHPESGSSCSFTDIQAGQTRILLCGTGAGSSSCHQGPRQQLSGTVESVVVHGLGIQYAYGHRNTKKQAWSHCYTAMFQNALVMPSCPSNLP